ncbi:hypothetical protein GXP67_27025 [Rhodocytophaga rosea]|uniref:DUF4421 domain-containing protein n=1 Tax=Rhodocytophaga rosea TaxID=2704465 RepID=A0A6C0GPQ5_9BACT|nr:hypothetical protein [Rhodocytophaga rosea]QHT70036.1 hypothetical protein GXP67_27025 [Rhodocytophaga rosea]
MYLVTDELLKISLKTAFTVKKKLLYWLLTGTIFLQYSPVMAQNSTTTSKSDIEYDAIYDDPYDINKLWLHFYPMYADGFVTNFNVGYGGQANYYLKDKFDFRLHIRKTYTKGSDFSRINGDKNSTVDNSLNVYKHFEGGATYHIIDKGDAGESKIVVYTKRYKANKWASTVPEHIAVPSKVRKIAGVRAGGFYWASATNLNEVLNKQKVYLLDTQGDTLSNSEKIYGNVRSAGIYLGGSISRIRNVIVKPKKYDVAVNDVIFTAYGDILFAPMLQVEDIMQNRLTYSASPIKTRKIGIRAGFEGMYNREFSWSYGAEIGYKPSIQTRGFYAMVKVGFAFASRLQQQRQSYQVEKAEK